MSGRAIDFSSIGGKPVGAPPGPTGSPSASSGGTKIDFSSVGGKAVGDGTPSPAAAAGVPEGAVIPESQRGAAAQAVAPVTGLISLPGHIIHAFNNTPETDGNGNLTAQGEKEKAFVEHTYGTHGLAPALGLGIYRLVVAPLEREHELAKAYETIANSGQDPVANANAGMSAKDAAKQQIKIALQQAGGAMFGVAGMAMTGPPAESLDARSMSYVHHVASIIPLLGPMAADVMEHYKQGDPTGAGTEILANIIAGKTLEGVTGKLAKGVRKIAPKTATVAGEEVPVMAGQLKDAAPIAKKVAAEPSPAIGEAQQAAAQRGVENVASEAANKQLGKMDPNAAPARADSFGDAVAQTKAAAQPTFKKLDTLSDGAFSTLQNTINKARTAARRATTVEDMDAAEATLKQAQDDVQALIKKHQGDFKPNELESAQSAWKDMQVLDDVHGYVEKAFSAPKSVAAKSNLVSRTLDGNKLISNLNTMVDKIPAADLTRVLGEDGLTNLYEIGKLASKPETAASVNTMVGEIASRVLKGGRGAAVGAAVAGPKGAAVGAAADATYDSTLRAIATKPRVASLALKALRAGTPAKIYGPLIASEINKSQEEQQ